MSDKVSLDFTEIALRLKQTKLPDVNLVVGIATGGVVPASLAAYRLELPLVVIHVNYRDPSNVPRYDSPQLQKPFRGLDAQKILLVDDVSVSGKTLDYVKELMGDREVHTLVMKGKADYVLFPEVSVCVNWPWKVNP